MNRLDRLWWRVIGFGFRLLYNELAWTYDLVSSIVSLGQWRQWQRTAIPHLKTTAGSSILELAHGTANLQIDLQAAGYQTTGIDLSPAMGRIARRKLTKVGATSRLVRSRGQALPFSDSAFDGVVSTFPTPFILHPDTLSEAYRVLSPGGRMVVVLSGLLTGQKAADAFLEWLYEITGQRGPWPDNELEKITGAGFTVTAVTEPLPSSKALLLVAQKPEAAPSAADESGTL